MTVLPFLLIKMVYNTLNDCYWINSIDHISKNDLRNLWEHWILRGNEKLILGRIIASTSEMILSKNAANEYDHEQINATDLMYDSFWYKNHNSRVNLVCTA